jgi:DNA-binding NarL/FixJ family response regulator
MLLIVLMHIGGSRLNLVNDIVQWGNGMEVTYPIRVLIVDDHRHVRAGLASILSASDDYEVLGAASNGLEAVDICNVTQPDIILMDMDMPLMDGLTATTIILARHPHIKIIILTAISVENVYDLIVAAGAHAHLSKMVRADELSHAIRRTVEQGYLV